MSACPLCRLAAPLPYASLGILAVERCPACRVTRVTEAGGPPRREADYAGRYLRESSADKARRCWDLVATTAPGWSGVRRLLDVGCGGGAFLDVARAEGLETAGIELSPEAAAVARRAGHRVTTGSAEEGGLVAGTFDAATMWDLLEHLDDPRAALVAARDALAPGGRLWIVTPMAGCAWDRAAVLALGASGGRLDSLARMCWSREHRFRFDPRGLAGTLRALGFRDVKHRPVLLLSLRPDRYAGGEVMPTWTGRQGWDAALSRAGVRLASALRLHNKTLVEAVRSET